MMSQSAGTRPVWLREWAGDSALLLFSQFAVTLATSVLAIIVARSLTPHEWGIFSGFLALSVALAVFAEFGLSAWVLRELSLLGTGHGDSEDTKRQAGRLVAGGFLCSSLIGSAFVVGTALCSVALRLDARLSAAVISLVAYSAIRSASTSLKPSSAHAASCVESSRQTSSRRASCCFSSSSCSLAVPALSASR